MGSGLALRLRLALFYAAYFLVIGIALPFWPVWLKAQGLGAAEIGLLLSAATWVKIGANPLVARIADRRGETRRPLVALAAGSLAGYALFTVADGFWPLLAATLLGSLCLTSIMPLGDSLTIRIAALRRLDYGRIRLWGSIAFIIAASGGGALFAGRAPDLILLCLLGAIGLTLAAALALPELPQGPAAAPAGGLLALLADRRFVLFLAATSLVQSSHALLYGFGTLHWQAAGHGKGVIGWLWAEGVIAEILLFAVGGVLLRRIGAAPMLVIGAAAAALRWLVTGLTTELAALAAVQLLHALSFGASHLAAMDFLARAAPPGLSATAQSLYAAVAFGAVLGLAMLLSGALYDAFAGGAFLAMAAMAALGMAAALRLARLGAAARQGGDRS